MSVIATLLPRVFNRSEELSNWSRGDNGSNVTPAGVKVTRETAIQLSAVWACVRLISNTISTLPAATFRRENGNRLPTARPAWLDQPNREQTRVEFVEQQAACLLLDGTAYVQTTRDRFGEIAELFNIHPEWVTPMRENGKIVYEIDEPGGRSRRLNESQMFHIPAAAWPGQIRGVSPVEAARRMLGLGLAAQEFAERFYGQGMHSSGLVNHPGDLTPEQARELKADFSRLFGGLRRSHLPAVLTGGATWTPLTITPEQAQFLETRRFSVNEIARWFQVPPHLVGDVEKSTSWGTGIEEQNIGFVTYTIRPWLERLEQSWTRHLLPTPGEFVKFNVDGLLRGDQKSRYEAYGQGRQWGWLNVDEIRAKEELAPLPGGEGQEYLVPTTHAPTGGSA